MESNSLLDLDLELDLPSLISTSFNAFLVPNSSLLLETFHISDYLAEQYSLAITNIITLTIYIFHFFYVCSVVMVSTFLIFNLSLQEKRVFSTVLFSTDIFLIDHFLPFFKSKELFLPFIKPV